MLSPLATRERANSPEPRLSTPPAKESLLDAAITQLLKERPSQGDSSYNSEQREQVDLYRIQRVQIECNSGDTLVTVNFPRGYANCRWVEWSSKRFCVDSERLLATGSKVFTNLLSPNRQARFRRRMEHDGELCPQRFVIDLTPSIEGDELAAQLMELSLPSGVSDWWTSKERLGISPYLVSGHDDHCTHHSDVNIDCKKAKKYTETYGDRTPNIDLADILPSESRIIDDYCPIRHRANIIRLILAIQGHDLVLNSAPRVYTLTAIANILDCKGVIRDPVCTWLMAEPNTEFVDINTEIALKIAWTLELANVTRAAFRILVVEKALDTLAAQPQSRGARHTIFGRPRADLPDDLQTVVQYAAHKLADRVQQMLSGLRSDGFYDLLDILEYKKLMLVGDRIRIALAAILSSGNGLPPTPEAVMRIAQLNQLLGVFSTLCTKLLEYKNKLVSEAMTAPDTMSRQRDSDCDRRCYVPRTDWKPTALICAEFSQAQYLLTPCFWQQLAESLNSTDGSWYPSVFVAHSVNDFNEAIDAAVSCFRFSGAQPLDPDSLHFDVYQFRHELSTALYHQCNIWTRPDLEFPLTRTNHLALGLSDDEFQYLPLWAGGLDDGTGGVFDSTVPDAELGPIGPGPAYHTGDTVATDASSICQSDGTPSRASTVTMTAGRSIAAVPSNMGPTTVHDAASTEGTRTMSTASSAIMTDSTDTIDEDDLDALDDVSPYDDSDEIDEEAWSQVEEP
ncbi:hypothetical protein F4677DRAFT_3549 [Hypoxylon crocopeplum]|nr:hypothetical protein F4677DRAFT_3549 [Hypoxylon crocopeplum]